VFLFSRPPSGSVSPLRLSTLLLTCPTPLLSNYVTLELNLCASQHITPDTLIHNRISLLPPSITLRLPRAYLNFTPDTSDSLIVQLRDCARFGQNCQHRVRISDGTLNVAPISPFHHYLIWYLSLLLYHAETILNFTLFTVRVSLPLPLPFPSHIPLRIIGG
jgi:hypothetical protein